MFLFYFSVEANFGTNCSGKGENYVLGPLNSACCVIKHTHTYSQGLQETESWPSEQTRPEPGKCICIIYKVSVHIGQVSYFVPYFLGACRCMFIKSSIMKAAGSGQHVAGVSLIFDAATPCHRVHCPLSSVPRPLAAAGSQIFAEA